MKKVLLLILFIFVFLNGRAQITLWDELANDSLNTVVLPDSLSFEIELEEGGDEDSFYVPDAWDLSLDTLLNFWHIKHYTIPPAVHAVYDPSEESVSDSIYADRLSKLPCIMDMSYNDKVRTSIDLYVNRLRRQVEYMLGLQALYFPMIEETLDKYGLPLELKYLAVVESALNPVALSRAGASGLWQFMLPTGKFYGLEINSLVDERRDPYKATDAACRYLRDLYAIYGDWNLAIAAYNCGPGNVNKAIKRANGKKDFWEIYPYLPKETRTYVPLFIAANYAMNYHLHHQLYPVETVLPVATDTIMVNDMIHLDQIAEVLQIEKEMILALNPQYKMDIIPGNSKPRILKLPVVQAYSFIEKQDFIKNYRADELLAGRTYTGNSPKEKTIHKVAKGENLTVIGSKYGVTVAEIRKWNGLKSNQVAAGRNLTIYADNGGYALNQQKNPAPKASSTSTANSSSNPAPKTNNNQEYTNYKVRSGDSFYTIAQKYPGYSHSDLMKINKVSNPSLRVGQVIKVPRI